MAQSAERPTLDFGPGHDLTVCGMELLIAWSLLGILSSSLSALPCSRALSLSLKINKSTLKKKKKYTLMFPFNYSD